MVVLNSGQRVATTTFRYGGVPFVCLAAIACSIFMEVGNSQGQMQSFEFLPTSQPRLDFPNDLIFGTDSVSTLIVFGTGFYLKIPSRTKIWIQSTLTLHVKLTFKNKCIK
ncbi:hypothetical protein HanPI659440_Chr06g0241031 [Helianthus annuus]|nr:hypothetical protein HanPI659440_Chr06g0241031 [Helianthus annuus]